jgi:hypothetical protein
MDETTLEKPKSRIDRPASHDPTVQSLAHTLRVAVFAWARHTFSLSSIISGLKTLLWLAPLSIIIWIYADRQLKPPLPQSVSMFVAVRSSDPSHVVTLVDPANRKVRAEIDGPNSSLEPLVKDLESGTVVELGIPESSLQTTGNRQIASSLLNDLPFFKDKGITVQSIEPTDLTINVDEIKDQDVEVQPAPDGKNFVSPPVFEPRKVRVRAPASVFKPGLVAYANLDDFKQQLTPGPHDLPAVPLVLSTGDTANVTITPPVVAAHVEIKKSDVPGTIPSVPIWATYPPGVDDKFKATYDLTLSGVSVTGPEDLVNELVNGTYKPIPIATFEVSAADQSTGGDHQAKLSFDLPPGVHVSPEFAQKMIAYRLVDRKSSE